MVVDLHFIFELFALACWLGDDDAKYIAGVLKVNTTLTYLDIRRESFFIRLCFFSLTFLLLDNAIRDAGVSYIAQVLKSNTTLNHIEFWSE